MRLRVSHSAQQRPRVPFSFPIRRISLSACSSFSTTAQKRHVGLPLRRWAVGLRHRTQGFGGMLFLATFAHSAPQRPASAASGCSVENASSCATDLRGSLTNSIAGPSVTPSAVVITCRRGRVPAIGCGRISARTNPVAASFGPLLGPAPGSTLLRTSAMPSFGPGKWKQAQSVPLPRSEAPNRLLGS